MDVNVLIKENFEIVFHHNNYSKNKTGKRQNQHQRNKAGIWKIESKIVNQYPEWVEKIAYLGKPMGHTKMKIEKSFHIIKQDKTD